MLLVCKDETAAEEVASTTVHGSRSGPPSPAAGLWVATDDSPVTGVTALAVFYSKLNGCLRHFQGPSGRNVH